MKTSTVKAGLASLLFAGMANAQTYNVLSPTEATQGFQLLFDGTIASFRSNFVNYTRNNSTNTNLDAGWILNTANQAVTMTTGSLPDTRSAIQYRDFDFRMDYRNNGNQGFIYRFTVAEAQNWATGIEFAIEDNVNAGAEVRVGAPYDLYTPPAASTFYNTFASNLWNSLRVVAKGDSVEHWMNNVKLAGFRYNTTGFWNAVTNSKWNTYTYFCTPTGQRNSYYQQGYIGLQADHGGVWQIRNMRILHDASAAQNRVCLGPVNGCATEIGKGQNARTSYSFERGSQSLRLSLDPALGVKSAELYDINGKMIQRVSPHAGTSFVLLNPSLFRKGVYFLQMETSTGTSRGKAYIP